MIRSLVVLWLTAALTTACYAPVENPDLPKRVNVYHPHITAVELPDAVYANTTVDCTIKLSAVADPALLTETGMSWLIRHQSVGFDLGVQAGTYHPGQFYGISIIPRITIASLGDTLVIPVTFNAPGVQYLYFAHAASAEQGGFMIPEDTMLAGGDYYIYDARSQTFVGYLELEVNVLP